MLELNTQTLRNLQMIELEMLIEVDRICQKCGIKYNIIGGTLLGSIRHNGFIPWDDDADLTLLRAEYNKFREVCKTELDSSRFYFQDAENTVGYRWSYGKIRRKNTLFLREFQEHMPYEQGVFIDIFPVDEVPDNYIFRTLHDAHCFCIRKILWSSVGRVADKRTFMRNWYSLLSRIPEKTVLNYYKKLYTRCNQKKGKRARIALMPLPNKGHGYLRTWFEQSADYTFETCMLKGIKDYQEFLTFEFGDYMLLPPENKRKVHPVSDIKLVEISLTEGKNV